MSEEEDLAAQMSKLSLADRPELDLRPLTPALLTHFAAVMEYLRVFDKPDKVKPALAKAKHSFYDYVQFADIARFL